MSHEEAIGDVRGAYDIEPEWQEVANEERHVVSLTYMYSQIRRGIVPLAFFCVNQWEEEKYISYFRYWLKSKDNLS
jgi:hypothetical protein